MRVITLAAALLVVTASPCLAGEARPAATAPAEAVVPIDLSANAAGIDAMAAERARDAVAERTRTAGTTQGAQRRSFWRTPWPYVIIGGVIVAGVIIASGDGLGY